MERITSEEGRDNMINDNNIGSKMNPLKFNLILGVDVGNISSKTKLRNVDEVIEEVKNIKYLRFIFQDMKFNLIVINKLEYLGF